MKKGLHTYCNYKAITLTLILCAADEHIIILLLLFVRSTSTLAQRYFVSTWCTALNRKHNAHSTYAERSRMQWNYGRMRKENENENFKARKPLPHLEIERHLNTPNASTISNMLLCVHVRVYVCLCVSASNTIAHRKRMYLSFFTKIKIITLHTRMARVYRVHDDKVCAGAFAATIWLYWWRVHAFLLCHQQRECVIEYKSLH